MDRKKAVFFFIGTEAELIKVFPIILECRKNDLPYHIIASGQNNIAASRIMKELDLIIDVELSEEADIRKDAVGLLQWTVSIAKSAKRKIRRKFGDYMLESSVMIVHGDTVSTVLGASIGKKLGMKVCHVEAGLRSHNIFNPFPEELDRMITCRMSDVHFAPGTDACHNLKRVKGQVINTRYNTILDSLYYAEKMPVLDKTIVGLKKTPYFVFVMHRQENLMNKNFVKAVIEKIVRCTADIRCVFILHKLTEIRLKELGLIEQLRKDKKIILIPRVEYFDFMKVLNGAEYVITDGGSNQEELYYMGKPCLILRKNTERNEGIGENAVMFEGDIHKIEVFSRNYELYRKNAIRTETSPKNIIFNVIKSSLLEERQQ